MLRHYTERAQLAYHLAGLELQRAGTGRLVRAIRKEHLTYLSYERLFAIARAVLRAEREGIPGEFLEAGCALGGSAILIARSNRQSRPLSLYDVFGTIPPPSDQDGQDAHSRYETIASGASAGIDGDTYYGYVDDLLDKVKAAFRRHGIEPASHNVTFVQGLYQDTMTSTAPVAFAHIDCDWYDSVQTCLGSIVPRLSPGGTIIVDDYLDWSGCRKAVDDYFATVGKENFEFTLRSNLQIRRRSSGLH